MPRKSHYNGHPIPLDRNSSRLYPQLNRWDVSLAGSAASQALACRVHMAGPCWWRLRSAIHQHRAKVRYLEGTYLQLQSTSPVHECWRDQTSKRSCGAPERTASAKGLSCLAFVNFIAILVEQVTTVYAPNIEVHGPGSHDLGNNGAGTLVVGLLEKPGRMQKVGSWMDAVPSAGQIFQQLPELHWCVRNWKELGRF